MSTAAATDAAGRGVDPLDLPILDQKPKKGDEAAPSGERERDGQQKSVDTAGKEGLGWLGALLLFYFAVPQLMWMGALGYLGHRLLF